MTQLTPFRFWEFVAADLRRAKQLANPDEQLSGVKLALGFFSPRYAPVLLCRLAHLCYLWRLKPLAKLFGLLNLAMFGIEVAVQCHIGKGLFLPHTSGTVIGAYEIGENAVIFQGVTLGARELDFGFGKDSRPILGDDVVVGSGAKVLGPLTIASRSRVAANSVVLESVVSGVLVAGMPARVVKYLN
jgi:serine O-acetyltransferase